MTEPDTQRSEFSRVRDRADQDFRRHDQHRLRRQPQWFAIAAVARDPRDACALAKSGAEFGPELLCRHDGFARLWGQQQTTGGEDHFAYSKRAMAQDQVEVIDVLQTWRERRPG